MMTTRESMEAARRRGLGPRIMLFMNDRALEWFSAFVMLGWGLTLIAPGETLAGPQFASFHRFGLTEEMWAWAFSLVGSTRLAALYINGRWPRSPHVRVVGAVFGVLSWAQVAWLITDGTLFTTGVPSTGTVVYGLLAVADLFAIARAMFDARYYCS